MYSVTKVPSDKSSDNRVEGGVGKCVGQGWKLKPKPKPENPVLKEIFETQTETDTYSAKFLKT